MQHTHFQDGRKNLYEKFNKYITSENVSSVTTMVEIRKTIYTALKSKQLFHITAHNTYILSHLFSSGTHMNAEVSFLYIRDETYFYPTYLNSRLQQLNFTLSSSCEVRSSIRCHLEPGFILAYMN